MNVTLLTQADCAFCDRAKEILDRLKPDFGFFVEEVALETPQGQSLAERNGVLFPPGIFLEDQLFSYGRPSERKLRRELVRRLGSLCGDCDA
jgi:glutaredoxin